MPWPIGLVVKNGSKARAITSGVMPVPVSVTQSETYWPGARSRSRAARSSSHLLAVSMVSAPPSRHGVAGVDAQVEQRVLQLGRVDQGRATGRRRRPPRPSIAGPDGAADQILHAGDQPVDVGRLGIERLAAREGQQPVGQRRRAAGRALRGADVALDAVDAALGQAASRSSSRLPVMPVSRLLKSCAMPPVSWPTASIFCDWRSASWAWRQLRLLAAFSSVMSRPLQ